MHSIQDLFPEELRLLENYINWIRPYYKKKIFTEDLTEERYMHMKNVLENVVNAYEALNYELSMVAPATQNIPAPYQGTRYSPLRSISPSSPAPILDIASVIPPSDNRPQLNGHGYMMGPMTMPAFSVNTGALMPVMQMPLGMSVMPHSPQRDNININMTVNTTADTQFPIGMKATRNTRTPKNHMDRVCSNCKITDTVQWRAGPQGKGTLCNKCGLKWAKEEGLHKSYTKKTPSKKRKSDSEVSIDTSSN